MSRAFVQAAAALAVGGVGGYLLGSRPGDAPPTRSDPDPAGRSSGPGLRSNAPDDPRVAALEQAVRERDAEIGSLNARLAKAGQAATQDAGDTPLEDARQRARKHLFDDPGLDDKDLLERAAAATTYTGQFHQLVVALHDRDVSTYLEAVWTARSAVARRSGVELSPEESSALMDVFRTSWLELRAWARSEHRRAIDEAQSMDDMRALHVAWATKVSLVYGGLNQRARNVLRSPERFDQVSRFL
jgi:hypothetical protein